jgi:osmotically-inducible protein OsmY
MVLLRVLTAASAGAGLMYLLDPDGGRRRRSLVRDQLVRAAHRTGDAVDTTSRDVSNRARGVVAELRSRLANVQVSDDVLRARVRARIGAVVGHAGAIEAVVSEGWVTLRGPILADDVDRLVRRVRAVPGVRDVVDQLEVHDTPGGVPGLQGHPRPPRGGEVFELLQTRWSPAARLFAGLAGAAMALCGVRRLDLAGTALAAGGVALLGRAVSNEPLAGLDRLAGGVARRG